MSDNYDAGQSILDIDTSDAIEPSVVEPGEYGIRITGYKSKEVDGVKTNIYVSESGNKGFIVNFDIPNEPTSKGFSKYFSLPSEDFEPKRNNAIKWELDCFKRAFNMTDINFGRSGQEGYALLKVTESEQYGKQNEVVKFITGA